MKSLILYHWKAHDTRKPKIITWLQQFLNRKNFEKCAKSVSIAKLLKTLFLTVNCVANLTKHWHHVLRRKIFEFIVICSKVRAQTGGRVSILLWSVKLRHLTGRTNDDDYCLPDAESFPKVYNMNKSAVARFACNNILVAQYRNLNR